MNKHERTGVNPSSAPIEHVTGPSPLNRAVRATSKPRPMTDVSATAVFDERESGPFAPDTMLPEQFFWALKHKVELDSERRLMMAILEDAVNCFRKHGRATDPKARQLFLDAEEWIASTDASWLFSFENVCATLGFDAEYLRRGLRKLQAAQAADATDPAPGDELRAAG